MTESQIGRFDARSEADAGREQLASILGEIDAIVWETDAQRHRFTFVSKRAEDMLGYPPSLWLEQDDFWRQIVHSDDLQLAELHFQDAIGRGEDHDYEYRVVNAEGQSVWVHEQVRVVSRSDRELQLRGVTINVTARRELEERLLQSQKMDAIGQLAGGVAHDFNNLLVVISGYTDLLLGRIEDETALGQLREISQAARRASALTAQLLAFGRRAPSMSEVVDLNVLISGIEPMLRRLIDEDIVLTVETQDGVEQIRGDSGQLEQVLVNLVINARDAMPLGGRIRIDTTTADIDDVRAAELGVMPGRCVVLRVADNGSGMTSETKARIFEPFFTTKNLGKGSGLGLATVYGIVEQAGGRVLIDTELGRGATFSVYFPALTFSDDDVSKPDDHTASRPAVLVVEDEAAVRRLVRSVLEDEGYSVKEAANGREALEHLEQHSSRIDLILTDVVMPDINGPELVTRLYSLGSTTPVLFMSGYAESQLLNRGLNEQTIEILRKPFTPEELIARVAELVASNEPEPSAGPASEAVSPRETAGRIWLRSVES